MSEQLKDHLKECLRNYFNKWKNKIDTINKTENDSASTIQRAFRSAIARGEKKRLQKLDDMQEEIVALNKNLTKCIDLLSKSISGPVTNNVFNDMHNSNRLFYVKTSGIIDEESTNSKININRLYQEKDDVIKEEVIKLIDTLV